MVHNAVGPGVEEEHAIGEGDGAGVVPTWAGDPGEVEDLGDVWVEGGGHG